MTELNSYKKEIPQLKNIKRGLKEKCYLYKQHLNDIKSGMLGSNGLAVRESLIEDIHSLKQKVAQLENELKQLTDQWRSWWDFSVYVDGEVINDIQNLVDTMKARFSYFWPLFLRKGSLKPSPLLLSSH